MLICRKYIIKKVPFFRCALYVFSEKSSQTKIETRSFKKNVVNDFSKLAYESTDNLQFINGKCLVYQNKRSILTSVMQASYYWIPMLSIGYTIYVNPFADIFPAAIPILGFIDIILFKLWLNKVKQNQCIVREIYLMENGEATEIWFANRLKRRLFGEEEKKIYYNSVFVEPDYEKQEVLVADKANRVFPKSIQEAEKQTRGYAWLKYYSNGQNFLVLPKKPDRMYLKTLIEIFKGKVIKRKV